MNTKKKGTTGENRAVDYLLNQGYTIISRNYQSKRGEIDCIAESQDGTLIFIEVKTAYTQSMGHPFHRVDRTKQRKIISMAKMYLKEHELPYKPCRFDVIAVMNNSIEHLKNAFLA